MTKAKVAALAVVTLLLIGGFVLAFTGRADAPLAKDTAAEEISTTTTTDPGPTPEEIAAAEAAEAKAQEDANLIAFWYFDYEQTKLDEEAARQEAQRQAEYAAQQRAAAPSYSPGPTTYGGSCAIPSYICQRESRFNYGAVNSSSGAGGMYQFMPGTWNSVAAQINPAYVGVAPQNAPPAVQDQFAAYLWNGGAGCGHWSAC